MTSVLDKNLKYIWHNHYDRKEDLFCFVKLVGISFYKCTYLILSIYMNMYLFYRLGFN